MLSSFEFLSQLRNRHFLLIDVLILTITPSLSLHLRLLDEPLSLSGYVSSLLVATLIFLTVKILILNLSGFYRRYWRYAGVDEFTQMAVIMISSIIVQSILFGLIDYLPEPWFARLPRSLPILEGVFSFILIGGVRFSWRMIERFDQFHTRSGDRVLVVGAGSAGILLVQEMQRDPLLKMCPVAFIDDAAEKLNLRIRGLPVLGNREDIAEIIDRLRIDKVIIAMPSASGNTIREIAAICQKTKVAVSTLPGMAEILNRKIGIREVREICIDDLLRREPIQTDIQEVAQFIRNKRVLITGAGGSIGSELCRQIFRCQPSAIILLGKGENSIFNIHQELFAYLEPTDLGETHKPDLIPFICDIRSKDRLKAAFHNHRPDLVFHAAAHKHVPLMEVNAPEAITTNVLGTQNLLNFSLEYNVEHFVMVSTDKAVNPTNVMGASKRTAEMLVLQAAKLNDKPYVAVRFGNVLGSRGSVIPTFKKQIAAGGPITITHPEVCRYFMTIPEAVQLVLQAAILGHGGQILMLDMGQPIKIVDLAKDLIHLSGYEVDKDIEITFTGLRPGEKLFEELFIPGEKYERTKHEKVLIVYNAGSKISSNLSFLIKDLSDAADSNDIGKIYSLLRDTVTGYIPSKLNTLGSSKHSSMSLRG